MKVAVGVDQRGLALGAAVIVELLPYGHAVVEVGGPWSADYDAPAHDVAAAILAGEAERGVVVSGSGVGASFVANKIDGVRAGAPIDTFTALYALENGMNVLCLGAGTLEEHEAAEIIAAFVAGESPAGAGSYARLNEVRNPALRPASGQTSSLPAQGSDRKL